MRSHGDWIWGTHLEAAIWRVGVPGFLHSHHPLLDRHLWPLLKPCAKSTPTKTESARPCGHGRVQTRARKVVLRREQALSGLLLLLGRGSEPAK